jgi:hypothetical protein
MIVIRSCFVAKPGNASKLAAQLKEAATDPAVREKMKGYTELWVTLSREILQVA